MQRWVRRGALATVVMVVLASVLAAPVGVKAFNRACDGSLEGLRYLSGVREQLAVATAPPPTPVPAPPTSTPQPTPTVRPTSTPPAQTQATATTPPTATATLTPAGPTLGQRVLEQAGILGDAALGGLVWVKQADIVAFPLHIVTAYALDTAGCREDAVRLQWLKAGIHASYPGQPERVAGALVARVSTPGELTDLRRVVRTWTERAWDNEPLRRVLAALDAHS